MSGPIKVIRVLGRLNIGGPAKHVIAVTQGLDPNRYQTILVVGREEPGEGNLLEEAKAAGVHPLIVPSLGRMIDPKRDLPALVQLIRLFRRARPHIVETHTAKAGFVGRLAARLSRVPVVVHVFHGNVFQGYFSPVVSRVFLGMERWLARSTDVILAVSPQQRDELLASAVGRPEQIRVVRLALRLDEFAVPRESRHGIRAELGIPPDAPVVGLVARLAPIKNVPLFLEAAGRIGRRYPMARFLIVGDGELRADMEARARGLGLDGRVVFAGWRRDMPHVYQAMDILTLTSKNEGTPVSLIEGLAAAVPMVATKVGGVPDVLDDGETGLVVTPDDPDALAEAVDRLLRDSALRSAMAEKARLAAQAYRQERLFEEMDRLYLDLLAKKGLWPLPQID